MTDTHLHYYRCPGTCRYSATVAAKVKERSLRCPVCQRFMAFAWTEPITTDEQRATAAKGIVFHAQYATKEPWTCKRCGEPQEAQARRHWPLGGVGPLPCCEACKDAQNRPDEDHLAAISARVAAMKAADAARLEQRRQQARELDAQIKARQTAALESK